MEDKNKNKKIKDILLKGGYVDEANIKKAEKSIKSTGVSLVKHLIREDLITKDILGQAIAEDFGVMYADLNSIIPSKEQILKIPERVGKKYRVILFKDGEKEVIVSTDNPKMKGIGSELKKAFPKKKVILAYSLEEDIEENLHGYQKSLDARFVKIIKKKQGVAPEVIDEILYDAFTYKASDIHFEPREKEVVVRFRIDGVLSEAGRIPKEYYENIINRIKIQTHLRIDEHYAAQDGAMRYDKKGIKVDLRISITPTIDGEKIVIRVLSEYVRDYNLDDLGFSAKDQETIVTASKKPFGMVLVTGPTGSGKTTTLYTILKLLNKPEVNITTIEDPVEYKIEGISQIQVNNDTDLTFAKGLRSIVRQDPDIILVGEIRDKITAEISVNAALTGHLLFSTFHANDAATSIPRLLDMGIEPFLLSSTLNVIVAQRLARKICDSCRHSMEVDVKDIEKDFPQASKFFSKQKFNLYKGKGCPACNHTGYKGRTAIFEIIHMTPEMQELVLKNPSAQEVWMLAKSQGANSLFEDGLMRVKNGITTLEELLRIASPSPYIK